MKKSAAYVVACLIALTALSVAHPALASGGPSVPNLAELSNMATVEDAPIGNDLAFYGLGGFFRLIGGFFRFGVGTNTTASPISASFTASRISGVAPLAVLFDASSSTDPTQTSYPFEELDYSWNFGDPGAGTWSYGFNTSKDKAYGPIAAHVFETPGTYVVNLTVQGSSGSVTATPVTITVSDPNVVFAGTNTICFSPTGNYTGCPAGAQTVQTSSFATVIGTSCPSAPCPTRLLLHAGETFTVPGSGVNLNTVGPGTIDKYDSGANPIIQASSAAQNSYLLQVNGVSDWRIRNLTIDPNGNIVRWLDVAANTSQLLMEKITAVGLFAGFTWSASGLSQLFAVENNISALVAGSPSGVGNIHFMSGVVKGAYLGNNFNDSVNGDHTIREQYGQKIVTSNNYFANACTTCAIFLIHGCSADGTNSTCTPGDVAGQMVVSDNRIVAGLVSGIISIAPESFSAGLSNEPIQDVIFERNWVTAGSSTQNMVAVAASQVSIRDNIFDGGARTSALNVVALSGTYTGPPLPSNNWIYNNTVYVPSSTNIVALLNGGDLTDGPISLVNTLAYSPVCSSCRVATHPTTAAWITQSNNSTIGQMQINPNFTNGSGNFSLSSDYTLGAGSYGTGAGTNVPVYYDFFRNPFTQGSYNLGAIQ